MNVPHRDLPDLLPGFAERLESRAEEVAATHRDARAADAAPGSRAPRWRRVRPVGIGVLVGLVAVSGAYATGLWRPSLGSNPNDRPVPVDRAVAASMLDRLAVLRRPQVDADRGSAAAYALRFPATATSGIQVDAVRTVGLDADATAVLVPMVDLRSGAQQLCLWVQWSVDAGGARTCANAADVREGKLVLAIDAPFSRATEADRAERRRRAQAGDVDAAGGVQQDSTAPKAVRVIGVAPDGVRAAWIGDEGPASVDRNLFDATVEREPTELRVRWDG